MNHALKASAGNEGRYIAALHIRASNWFEKNGLAGEAIHHALTAKDFERAAALIERAWSGMDKSLQSATWLGWAKMIPDELVRKRPVLSAGYAWALLDAGEIESCEPRLQDAEKWLEFISSKRVKHEDTLSGIVVADEEQFRLLPVTIAAARAYKASAQGDIKATIKFAKKAMELIPDENCQTGEVANTLLGLAQWANGELEAAYTTITDGIMNKQMEIRSSCCS